MLTDKQLLKIKAGLHADGGGLYLRVSPKGLKTWLLRNRTQGGDSWKSIGHYPSMSLAEARRFLSSPQTLTMDAAIKVYMSKLSVKRPEHVKWLLSPLSNVLLQTPKRELVNMLQKKAETAPVMANRMLTRWHDLFSFCVQQGWIESNPLSGVQRKFIGGKETSRNRVLSWDEIKELPNVLPPNYLHCYLFILLTGLRPSEAIYSLTYSRTVDIPTKTTPHTLPRSHLIQYALKQKLKLPASDLTLSNALRRKGLDFRPHDLRRTFVTRLNDLGVAPYVVEKLVNHKLQGVMAVYNHAEYWAERHAAQRLWDKKLLTLWRTHGCRAPSDT